MTAAAWVVECPAYTAGPWPTEETAVRRLAEIEALGACMYDHKVRRDDA